jgi:hypothetical protein
MNGLRSGLPRQGLAEDREDVEGLEAVAGEVDERPSGAVVGCQAGDASGEPGPEPPVQFRPALGSKPPADGDHPCDGTGDHESERAAERHARKDVEDERPTADEEECAEESPPPVDLPVCRFGLLGHRSR